MQLTATENEFDFVEIVTAEEYEARRIELRSAAIDRMHEKRYEQSLKRVRQRRAVEKIRIAARRALELARAAKVEEELQTVSERKNHSCYSCGIYLRRPVGNLPQCEVCSGDQARLTGGSREGGEASDRQYHGSTYNSGEW